MKLFDSCQSSKGASVECVFSYPVKHIVWKLLLASVYKMRIAERKLNNIILSRHTCRVGNEHEVTKDDGLSVQLPFFTKCTNASCFNHVFRYLSMQMIELHTYVLIASTKQNCLFLSCH